MNPPDSRETQVQGRPASYLDMGEGPVALFLHGWGLSHDSYRPALRALAGRGRRVLAPALPAFGGTAPLPDGAFSLEGYGAWVATFLEAVGVDAPVMAIGHSFGGGVAIRVGHDRPDLVSSMVLVNSVGGSAWSGPSLVGSLLARPPWDWGLHLPKDRRPLRQLTRVLPVMLEDLVPNAMRNPRAVWRAAGLASRADLTAELQVLHDRGLPVVILWGESDRLIPERALDAIRDVLGAEAVTSVPGAHNWLLSDPSGFIEVISDVSALLTRPEADPRTKAS